MDAADFTRLGWPECVMCERPAIVRARQWADGNASWMGICYLHYIDEMRDPNGKERPWMWIEGRGRK